MKFTKRFTEPFTMVSNELAQARGMSFECRGLILYLLSKPETWECQVSDIEREGGIGTVQRRRITKEAELAGWLYFEKSRNEKGQFNSSYVIQGRPLPENLRSKSWESNLDTLEATPSKPTSGNQGVDNPTSGDMGGLVRKESEIKELEKRESGERTHARAFEENPSDSFSDTEYRGLRPKPVAPILQPELSAIVKTLCRICQIYPDTMTPMQFNDCANTEQTLSNARHFKTKWLSDFREFWDSTRRPGTVLKPAYVLEHWGTFLQWLINVKGIDINEKS